MTMHNHELIFTDQEIEKVAMLLADLKEQVAIYTFAGSLGAGKTTLISAILACWGVKQPVMSPTFATVHVYQNAQGQTFYHFDLYRIQSLHEFIELGFHEYLYTPDSWALIEWPEVVEPLLQGRICKVMLEYIDEKKRLLRYTIKE